MDVCRLLAVLVTASMLHGASAVNETSHGSLVEFHPGRMDGLVLRNTATIFVEATHRITGSRRLRCAVADVDIVELVRGESIIVCAGLPSNASMPHLTVRGLRMGRTFVDCRISDGVRGRDNKTTWTSLHSRYMIAVIRAPHLLDNVFFGLITIIILCVNIGMGCAIDLEVVKAVLVRPVAPAIGFFSQFLVMPLVAYTMVRLFDFSHGTALGYFAVGCAPGGGHSNIYTFLFHGDVSLSITMTFVSVVASLAMLPIWLLTLGQTLLDDDSGVVIPFARIASSLFIILVPLTIGIFIGRVRPRAASVVRKLLRPFFFFVAVIFFPIALYINVDILRMFTVVYVLAGCCVPYAGFLLGAILSTVFRQSRARIITIALETGIQNIGIPILVMQNSLPHPEAEIAMIGPIAVAIATPLPLWLGLIIQEVHRRCCRELPEVTSDQDTKEVSNVKEREVDENDIEASKDLLEKHTPTAKVQRKAGALDTS